MPVTPEFSAVVLAFIMVINFMVQLVLIFGTILTIIARWFIYRKAGQPGWATLIPFYNSYVMSKTAKFNNIWAIAAVLINVGLFVCLIIYIAYIANMVLATVGMSEFERSLIKQGMEVNMMNFILKLMIPVTILFSALIVWWTFVSVRLAKLFKRADEFAIGNAFLWYVFVPVLAFTADIKYIDSDDVISKNDSSSSVADNNTDEITEE